MKALIFGASGLTGSELLKLVLNDPYFSTVTIIVRKTLPIKNDKLTQIVSTFEELERNKGKLVGDILFSCLGSTKKKTPDQRDYYAIDHDYPILGSRFAIENGVKSIHIISSIGANSSSSNSYLKMKGEVEDDISDLDFEEIHIYRPSLITGTRQERRPLERMGEAIMNLLNPLMVGSLKKYRSISANEIARAMCSQAKKGEKGLHIYPSNTIRELA